MGARKKPTCFMCSAKLVATYARGDFLTPDMCLRCGGRVRGMIDRVSSAAFLRGVRAAAEVAAPFDKHSSHGWLVSDVVLCKYNATTRVGPRVNKHHYDQMNRGIALALAEVVNLSGHRDVATAVLRDAGLTYSDLVRSGVEGADLDALKLCFAKRSRKR